MKCLGEFLNGFCSSINLFGNSKFLKLSDGGFRGDYLRLSSDVNKIKIDFSEIINGQQKNRRWTKN